MSPPHSVDDIHLPGTIISGKYRVERTLGEGGMAIVVEAVHASLGHRVAIKVLRGDTAREEDALKRFRREAQIAAQLPGEHIARVTDLGQTESGEPFLVMELLRGRDLEAEVAARGALPIEEAVDYVLQACEGVAEAHAAGLVHRDLKPGNLFLARRRDGTAVIKVLDFGISKAPPGADQALTMTSANVGTPLYMSPEQIQSAKHVDARCDQHALGAILYTLLAGVPPYRAESLTALAVVIATKRPPPLHQIRKDVPPELEAVVMRALAKNPDDRFEDIEAFARGLAGFGGIGATSSIRSISSALAAMDAARGRRGSVKTGAVASVAASQHEPRIVVPADPQAQTSAPITTALDSNARVTRTRRLLGAIVAMTAGGAAALALYVMLRSPSSLMAPGAVTTAAQSTAIAPDPSAATPASTVTAAAFPDPTATPTAVPGAAQAAATASASTAPAASAAPSVTPRPVARPRRPPGTRATELPPPPPPLEPTQVFNKR